MNNSVFANIVSLVGPQGLVLLGLILFLWFGGKLLPQWVGTLKQLPKSFRIGWNGNDDKKKPKDG